MKTRTPISLALLALLTTLPHCTSDDSAAGSGGNGGSGGTLTDAQAERGGSSGATDSGVDAPALDAADADGGCSHVRPECCSTKYGLDADADVSGLCDPAENIECSCTDSAAAGTVECSADGTQCCSTVNLCIPSPRCGWVDCGEGKTPVSGCPATQQVFDAGRVFICIPCTKDEHCYGGKRCSVRLANRMFCEE